MVHSDPEAFDAFYKEARDRLLLQTYVLTGDLPASRGAVRDSFVVAWHHWHKVARLESPESSVRPRAWAQAQRRHTTRLWHRDKGLSEEHRATLAALAKLSLTQRKLLVLTHLAQVSLGEMAREVSLPREAAERELQLAMAQFSLHRQVPTTSVRPAVEALAEALPETVWPRPTILRRAGAARRRTHTAVGVVATVAALLLSGSVVGAAGDAGAAARGSVADGERSAPVGSARVAAGPTGSTTRPAPAAAPQAELGIGDLLTLAQARRLAPRRGWRVTGTGDNTEGDGLVMPCQQAPFADPDGVTAAVRRFHAPRQGGRAAVRGAHLVELSSDEPSAREAYRRARAWYAGCHEPRTQLLDTYALPAVGDEAVAFVLRRWGGPGATTTITVARTGRFTSTLARTVADQRPADVGPVASLTAAAVNGFCGAPGAGECAAPPRPRRTPPLPAGREPVMLSAFDLPPVTGVRQPWVGTDPAPARVNAAATRCDETDFSGLRRNLTRTFVAPGADLSAAFGLTETVGRLPSTRAARAFVDRVRSRLERCGDKDLVTVAESLRQRRSGDVDVAAWRVTTEISDAESVRYLMAVVRRGRAVAQLGFVPSDRSSIATDDFLALVGRAGDRLATGRR